MSEVQRVVRLNPLIIWDYIGCCVTKMQFTSLSRGMCLVWMVNSTRGGKDV